MKRSQRPRVCVASVKRSGVVDQHRAKHFDLGKRSILTDDGVAHVTFNDSESPLSWLARRKGRDGQPMISPQQFLAGEKLRADFTLGHMAPRVTSNWSEPTGRTRSSSPGEMTDLMLASRQRVSHAMDASGPEFAGLLMDVCCFLRGLEDVERERGWPPRTAKIVLQLALDRLARHYGFTRPGRPDGMARVRSWTADDAVSEG